MIRILLRPIAVLLLDGGALDVVGVHDLLDALVVVKDRESGHLIEICQVRLIPIATADERITCRHQGVPFHTSVLHCAGLAFTVSLFRPIGACVVVESFRAAEIAGEDLGFALDVVFDVLLAHRIVARLMHGKIVILNRVLGLNLAGRDECFLVCFTEWLTVLVSDDVPAFDLLVDGRVMDQCALAIHTRAVIVVSHRLLLLKEICRRFLLRAFSSVHSQDAIVHALKVVIGTLSALQSLTGGVSDNKFVSGHAMILSAIS